MNNETDPSGGAEPKSGLDSKYKSKYTNLRDDNYVRPKQTQQDIISADPKLLEETLKGFIKIHPQHYDELEPGFWIRYISKEGKYRSGGLLKVNKAPEYFIIKSPYQNKSWSINLTKQEHIFIKATDMYYEKMVEKKNLYKLFEAGLVEISPKATPEEIQRVLES